MTCTIALGLVTFLALVVDDGPPAPPEAAAPASAAPTAPVDVEWSPSHTGPDAPDAPVAVTPAPTTTDAAAPTSASDVPLPALPVVDDPVDEPSSTERAKVAVVHFDARGVPRALADTLAAHVAVTLDGLAVMDVITQAEIESMIDYEAFRNTLVRCDVVDCLRDMGGALGARFLVTGAVGATGTETLVHLALVDLERMGVVARGVARGTTPASVLAAVAAEARALARPILAGRTGTLFVTTSEEGAQVSVDGKLVGTTPLARLELPSGPHRVDVGKDGFFATALDVTVNPGTTTTTTALLIPSQDLVDAHRTLAWGVIGGGGAALAVAGGLLVTGAGLWLYQYAVLFPQITSDAPRDDDGTHLVAGEEYLLLWSMRLASYALMLSSTIPLAGGTLALALAPDPSKYDHLIAE